MRILNHSIKTILAVALFCFALTISAQVTLGSVETAAMGAILDVRSQASDAHNTTSTLGGIVMPRVKLVNIHTLEPIIANDDPELEIMNRWHIGLKVYNLNNNEPFTEGLYVWNGTRWEEVILTAYTNGNGFYAKNGLQLVEDAVIELGGELIRSTVVNINNNNFIFCTDDAAFSINNDGVLAQNGRIGIGKEPGRHLLDIAGKKRIDGNLKVRGNTLMQDVEIIGTANAPAFLQYKPAYQAGTRIAGRFLTANSRSGRAFWSSIGGLEVVNMDPLPANTIRFNPTNTASQENFIDTRLTIELPPGRWLINFSVRMVTTALNTASTTAVIPSMFRFTMLENGVPIPSGAGIPKPYHDSRAFPDTYFNSLSGFFIVTNDSYTDKTYTLGIKTQQLSPSWVNGDVEIINRQNNDAFLIPIFLGFPD